LDYSSPRLLNKSIAWLAFSATPPARTDTPIPAVKTAAVVVFGAKAAVTTPL
jgi:hypothetical protein